MLMKLRKRRNNESVSEHLNRGCQFQGKLIVMKLLILWRVTGIQLMMVLHFTVLSLALTLLKTVQKTNKQLYLTQLSLLVQPLPLSNIMISNQSMITPSLLIPSLLKMFLNLSKQSNLMALKRNRRNIRSCLKSQREKQVRSNHN